MADPPRHPQPDPPEHARNPHPPPRTTISSPAAAAKARHSRDALVLGAPSPCRVSAVAPASEGIVPVLRLIMGHRPPDDLTTNLSGEPVRIPPPPTPLRTTHFYFLRGDVLPPRPGDPPSQVEGTVLHLAPGDTIGDFWSRQAEQWEAAEEGSDRPSSDVDSDDSYHRGECPICGGSGLRGTYCDVCEDTGMIYD